MRLLGETSGTKFSRYQLAGEKENYKEVLVTLPGKIISDKYLNLVDEIEREKEKNGESERYFELIRKQNSEEYRKLKPTNLKNKWIEERRKVDKANFKSSHFDEPNILVHLRMNTRTDSDGNKVLFLEEVQSDFGQSYKKEQGRDRKSTRLNSSHRSLSRMPSSA